MNAREAMLHWVREREAVRLRREAGAELPATDDPIIAKYRFCNVRREDDRVTVWIRKHIREPFADDPNLWFMLAIARWINWPETLDELMKAGYGAWPDDTRFSVERLAEVLHRREARGDKVFTGVYTINAPSTKGASKIDHVARVVLGEPWKVRAKFAAYLDGGDHTPSLRYAHAALTKFKGWGAFMAYQVVVDWRFTRLLRDALDIATWAAAGPGTIRGLNRIAGRPTAYPLQQWQALIEMRLLYETIQADTGVAMDFSDVPNVMCETDKYLRVLNGEGAPRTLYKPHGGAP
jgi:5-hmdU DNA kinase, helical domain